MFAHRTARGLGWFSIGLGLAEVLATKSIANAMRLNKRPGMLRMFGMREMATGAGLLSRRPRASWMWARVAGDVMDLMTLGKAFTRQRKNRGRLGMALAAVAGVTALDVMCGRRLRKMRSQGYNYQI